MNPPISRRSALGRVAGSAALLATVASLRTRLGAAEAAAGGSLKGRINHSACKWCYPKVSLEDLCLAGKEMGLQSIDLLEVKDFPTIKKHHQYFGHYHTGGVPGRNEIDDTQEIHYPAVMKAIAETGFQGHVAQEFIPKRPDALASLKQGVTICDV